MKKRLAATSLSKSLKPALPATKKFNQPSGFAGDYILLQSWGNVNFPEKLVRPSPVTIKKGIENQAPLRHSEVRLRTKESMIKWKWVQDETKNTPCLKIKRVMKKDQGGFIMGKASQFSKFLASAVALLLLACFLLVTPNNANAIEVTKSVKN